MSKTRVKTTYSVQGAFGSTVTEKLYCVHNHSSDSCIYYDEDGEATSMVFYEWDDGNDLWDAMKRLRYPFKKEWHKELKEGVEYFKEIGE